MDSLRCDNVHIGPLGLILWQFIITHLLTMVITLMCYKPLSLSYIQIKM